MRSISSFIPAFLKSKLKSRLLTSLHAKPEIVSRIATRVIRDGMPRYLKWNFDDEKKSAIRYIETLRVNDFAYRFAHSSYEPSLYGSIYACLLFGMYGELQRTPLAVRNGWLDYLDGYQDPVDGFFRDPLLAGPAFDGSPAWGDGWGIRHLAAHVLIAYARLGRPPRYPFKFLEQYYDQGALTQWLNRFHFKNDVWSQSNYIMNVYSLLQYARDYMDEKRASFPIDFIRQWLLSNQRQDTGMWHDYQLRGYPEIGDAIRGAYHFYPLLIYERHEIPHPEPLIDTILRSQNSWGGFNPEETPSGACEDIDAIEPLIRASLQTSHRKAEIQTALNRAMLWILSCRNSTGGFESIPDHGFSYGGHPLTTSEPGEPNLFATWFRTLSLAYIVDYLSIPNDFSLGAYPGYEIMLRRQE
jgi:hypothetical protein